MGLQRNDELLDEGRSHVLDSGTVPAAPGKRSLTAGLAPSAGSVAREVVRLMRKDERDANGVAPDAEEAIAGARASSGTPLPDDVRTTFESSLGADLSSVRVHTGARSAAAASAVGARAYTTGQDIHFNAGQYAPADPFGIHLLAHEVAHTVQQSGGATTMQYKLDISTPGDAAEIEADRAADAMVAGTTFRVSGTASRIDRAPLPSQMLDAAEAAEAAGARDPFAGATTIKDRATAQAALDQLDRAEDPIGGAIVDGSFPEAVTHQATNKAARLKIEAFLKADERRSVSQDHLAPHAVIEQQDYNRLKAQITTLLSSDQSKALSADAGLAVAPRDVNMSGLSEPDELGSEQRAVALSGSVLIAAGGQYGQKKLTDDFQRVFPGNSQVSSPANGRRDKMNQVASQVGRTEQHFSAAQQTMQGQATNLLNVIAGQNLASIQSKLSQAAREAGAVKNTVKVVVDGLSAVAAFAQGPTGWPKVLDAVLKVVKVVDGMTTYGPNTESEEAQTQVLKVQQAVRAIRGATEAAEGAAKTFDACAKDYADARFDLETEKKAYRSEMKKMGDTLDRLTHRNGAFAAVAQVLADAEAFVAQANATLAVGANVEQETQEAKMDVRAINGVNGSGRVATPFFTATFTPKRQPSLDTVWYAQYHAYPHSLEIAKTPKPGMAADLNQSETSEAGWLLKYERDDLMKRRDDIAALATELKKVFAEPAR